MTRGHRLGGLVIAFLGVCAIGWIDYLTGYELRIFPLYFGPVAYASSVAGRTAGLATGALAASTWLGSNMLAGIPLPAWILGANAALQFTACAWIAILIARLHDLLVVEKRRSRVDALTGLANQRAFRERAELELARQRRHGGSIVVACVDLDRFKEVNDTSGHAVGDRVLELVGRILKGSVRANDLAARIGGDEFAVLLPDTSLRDARVVLDRARDAIARAMRACGWPVTASIGAAAAQDGEVGPDALLAHADAALYAAKRGGRNQVRVA